MYQDRQGLLRDLTRHTESELWVMDKKIDIMLTTEMVAEVSFEEGKEAGIEIGKEKGIGLGKTQIIEALQMLKGQPFYSDNELINKFGLSPDELQLLKRIL